MSGERDWRLLLPEPVRTLPADLTAVVLLTVITVLVVTLPGVRETPIRVLLGLPFVLFLPGYAFIAALFPEQGHPPSTPDDTDDLPEEDAGGFGGGLTDRGIDGIERVALSFGLSIAIVPLIGLVLNFTPWGIRLTPILVSVSAFTLACVAVAHARRRQLPPDERFTVPYCDWLAAGRAEIFEPEDRVDAALNVLLALAILLALASVTFAIVVPPEGERFTEFYILTEQPDGDLVAANYPTEFVTGDTQPIVIGVGNQEHETTTYTVVIQLQRVDFTNNQTQVLEREELDRFALTVDHDDTQLINHTITPRMTGENLRLTFLLYQNDPPPEPTRENAYRDLHLWIDVYEPT